jgi:hypothetical protein
MLYIYIILDPSVGAVKLCMFILNMTLINNLGDGGIGEDREQDGRTRNTLSFKGTGLKT